MNTDSLNVSGVMLETRGALESFLKSLPLVVLGVPLNRERKLQATTSTVDDGHAIGHINAGIVVALRTHRIANLGLKHLKHL